MRHKLHPPNSVLEISTLLPCLIVFLATFGNSAVKDDHRGVANAAFMLVQDMGTGTGAKGFEGRDKKRRQ